MARYVKTQWNTTTVFNPTNMNHIEQGIYDADLREGGTIGGDLLVNRPSTTTTYQDAYVTIGNNIAEGTVGNSRGILRIYDRNQNCVMMYPDNVLTATRYLNFPNNSGTLALTSDLSDDVVSISDFATSDGRFYTKTFTVIKRARFPFLILRLRQGGDIPTTPIVFGSVDNQGSTLVMNFSDSSVTFNASTQTLTVDAGGSAWATPVIFVPRNCLK